MTSAIWRTTTPSTFARTGYDASQKLLEEEKHIMYSLLCLLFVLDLISSYIGSSVFASFICVDIFFWFFTLLFSEYFLICNLARYYLYKYLFHAHEQNLNVSL